MIEAQTSKCSNGIDEKYALAYKAAMQEIVMESGEWIENENGI